MRSIGSLTSGLLKSLFHLSTVFVPVCLLGKAFNERNAMMTKESGNRKRSMDRSTYETIVGGFHNRYIAQNPVLKFGNMKRTAIGSITITYRYIYKL